MTATTHTLTGFGDFLERRRVTFVEPLPSLYFCSVCGLVSPETLLLPCNHVVCAEPCGRFVSNAGSCALDGSPVTTANVLRLQLEKAELDKLLVHCPNGTDSCNFSGKLSTLEEHYVACNAVLVECSKCGGRVLRDAAASDTRTCCNEISTNRDETMKSHARLVEEIGSMKRDLEKLCESLLEQGAVTDVIVDDVNSLLGSAVFLDAPLASPAEEKAEKLPSSSALTAVVPPGPYRTAACRGAALILCDLEFKTFAGRTAAKGELFEVKGERCTLLGYTFYVSYSVSHCKHFVTFALYLCSGSWDSHVDWPFAKHVTLIIPHLRNANMDIALSVNDAVKYQCYEKPTENSKPAGIFFDSFSVERIVGGHFVHQGKLYVNVQFM